MGLDQVQIDVTETENCANITLSGDGLGVLIGRRGETLDALQYLAGLVANRLEGDYYRIVVDSGNYREKREKPWKTWRKIIFSSYSHRPQRYAGTDESLRAPGYPRDHSGN